MQSKGLAWFQLGMQVRPGQTHGNHRIKQHKKDRRISQNQPEGIAVREAEYGRKAIEAAGRIRIVAKRPPHGVPVRRDALIRRPERTWF